MHQPTFQSLHLPQSIKARIAELGFVTPTPIQELAIPVALKGKDLVGIADTGTGKTLAFGIPMAAKLHRGSCGLVLAPTRELASQIAQTLRSLGLSTALLIGGAPMNRQVSQLRSRPRVIVATPGRLIDHMKGRTARLDSVSIVVLDEADRMLDMGFAPAIEQILEQTPQERQTLLFSATMPQEIERLVERHTTEVERVQAETPGAGKEAIQQELVMVKHENKRDELENLISATSGPVLVFTRTRHGARKLANLVRGSGFKAAEIHSDRTQNQRTEAMNGFRSGFYQVLVATDIAARGIDVKEIALVVNFDLPETAEDYLHRIGRTGRAGAAGRAVTFATPQQQRELRFLEKALKGPLGEKRQAQEHTGHGGAVQRKEEPELQKPSKMPRTTKVAVGGPQAEPKKAFLERNRPKSGSPKKFRRENDSKEILPDRTAAASERKFWDTDDRPASPKRHWQSEESATAPKGEFRKEGPKKQWRGKGFSESRDQHGSPNYMKGDASSSSPQKNWRKHDRTEPKEGKSFQKRDWSDKGKGETNSSNPGHAKTFSESRKPGSFHKKGSNGPKSFAAKNAIRNSKSKPKSFRKK